ncbi:MAG: ATP-binding protein [Actinomycetota bacterium]|nr:ATP-binding protein [Actinomycetota bacterium]
MTERVVDSGPRPARNISERGWTLRRRLGAAFGTVAALLAVLVTAVVVSAVLFAQSGNDVVYRWQPAMSAGNRLLTDMIDQETSLRGYALNRDRLFLEPYARYSKAQLQDDQRLRALVGGDRQLRALLSEFEQVILVWRNETAEPAAAALGSAGAAEIRDGVAMIESLDAKARFDRLRAGAQALNTALVNRTAVARDARTADGVVFAVALSLLMLVVAACGVALWRGLHRWVLGPVDRLGAQTRTVAAGDRQRAIVPDGPRELTTLGRDVEAMRKQIVGELFRANAILDALRVRTEELARSNDDLQQFAYVASHDLSEPLRKVANFCQLLERQYGPQLDDKARQYIDFAVDGAKRMQVLITDLLALSRVGRTTEQFVPVDLDAALDRAIANLGERVDSAGATIVRTHLPTVAGDRSLLTSLLENLVGNAVKYRRDDVPPEVVVTAELDDGTWTVTVRDNGIGIDAQYAERIFAVFQRLHLRDQYGGTGIGLALCRRIVEFHGGRIWLETRQDAESDGANPAAEPESAVESALGATFRFTISEGGAGAQPRD